MPSGAPARVDRWSLSPSVAHIMGADELRYPADRGVGQQPGSSFSVRRRDRIGAN